MNTGFVVAGALSLSLVPSIAAAEDERHPFTREFPVETCEFQTTGKNPYFTLRPGRELRSSNARCVAAGDCQEFEEAAITVLDRTRGIELELDDERRTVTTRVVEEVATLDGELAEVSRNFFAECKGTQDVYYFGEEVDIYENGVIVSHEGAWLAGQDDAEPGIIMPGGAFLLGSRYFQEHAPGVALDRAEHVGVDLDVRVPAGTFEDCVEVRESTPLDPDETSTKIYCPGTGLVVDDDLELEGSSDTGPSASTERR